MPGPLDNDAPATWDTSFRVIYTLRPIMAAAFIIGMITVFIGIATSSALIVPLIASVLCAIIAYAVFVHVLSDETATGRALFIPHKPEALSASIILVLFVQATFLLADHILAGVFSGSETNQTGSKLLAKLVYLLLVARYGTLLPSIITGADVSLSAASARSNMLRVAWRLFLAHAVGVVFLLVPLTFLEIFGFATGPSPLFMMLAVSAAGSLFYLWVIVSTTVILSKAFHGAYP